ncbi:hypothetical protein DEO72_LG11g1332 [Vigna unguiculata]|uniref:Uncharacterized protein n=1 Tax=Vigna unguiculata TaxID=3917 RepID=A0A4D6NKL4_VIGUN|nr:hypothetical protein DEO72_LG11g1332 [Vigna unguiculata]
MCIRDRGNTGSRLSEIPRAWASCLLAQHKCSDPHSEGRTAPRAVSSGTEWQNRERSGLLPNPNDTENTNHERKEHELRSDLREQGLSSSLKEGDLRANPSRAFRESKGKD